MELEVVLKWAKQSTKYKNGEGGQRGAVKVGVVVSWLVENTEKVCYEVARTRLFWGICLALHRFDLGDGETNDVTK